MKPKAERGLIAQQLIYIRTMTGLTQPEFSKLMGIQRASYANYEAGRIVPKEAFLRKAAQVLGVAPEVLLHPEENILDSATVRLNDTSYVAPRGLSSLPADEKMLVGLYRLLSEEEREKLLATLEKSIQDEEITG